MIYLHPQKVCHLIASIFLIFIFYNQVYAQRPTPHMYKERRAMILLRRVVEAYLDGGGGNDWRFCLLTGSLLSEISMNNVTKGNAFAIWKEAIKRVQGLTQFRSIVFHKTEINRPPLKRSPPPLKKRINNPKLVLM